MTPALRVLLPSAAALGALALGAAWVCPDRQCLVRTELHGDLLAQFRRCRKQAVTAATEGLEQGAVGKLADDFRTQLMLLQPGIDVGAQRMAARRQQQRRAVEALREVGRMALVQLGVAVQIDPGLANQVRLQLEVGIGRRRPVGQHHVEAVHRQLGEQMLEAALGAFEAIRQGCVQRGMQQAEGHQLGQGIAQSHRKALPGAAIGHGVAQALAEEVSLRLPAGRDLPILAATALSEAESAARCRTAGANAHLTKPISLHALAATLRTLTGIAA